MRRFLMAAIAMIAIAGSTQASHIFSTNIRINGTPVAAGNAFTDPNIVIFAGDTVTFSFDLFDTDPSATSFADTFNVSFGASTGTLPAPANASFAYLGNGTSGTPVNFSFNRTFNLAGNYDGFLIPNFPVSFPDYIHPGGNQLSEPQVPFSITVLAVPEPASMAIFGAIAVAGIAGLRRRMKKA